MKRQNTNKLLHHIALWLPLIFATPLIVMAKNPDDFFENIYIIASILALVLLTLSVVSLNIVKALKFLDPKPVSAFIVSLATVLVVQGYVVHGLIDYGQLDGSIIDWKGFGSIYWLETSVFILMVVILAKLYLKLTKHLTSISASIVFFSLAQLLIVLPSYFNKEIIIKEIKPIDSSVFEFSSTNNIIHILADGFQADIVKQVLSENPDIAAEFSGFNFFQNHLGRFQGTSPTIPTIFSGTFFDLDKGYTHDKVKQTIKEKSYTNVLFESGYRLDFAPISSLHCPKQARNCDILSFNHSKPHGYIDKKTIMDDVLMLIDVSLFRHSPMVIKQTVYNGGAWLLSSKFSTRASSYPYPVIKEWTENMQVTTETSIYKWYHFIGTHIPAQWGGDCSFLGRQPQERAFYLAQTECILNGMANFFKKLKKEKIYDISTIIINGDHGCNIAANDLHGETTNQSIFTDRLVATARPLFMLKKPNSKSNIKFHDAPTTMEDIAPTILDVVGLNNEQYSGISAFKKPNDINYKRFFLRYNTKTYWDGEPVEYVNYQVTRDIRNRSNWQLLAMKNRKKAPSSYNYFSYNNAIQFTKGMSLSRENKNEQKSAAIIGTEFFVLLSDKENKSTSLTIKLKVYDHTQNQSVSVYVNNQKIAEKVEIQPVYNEWVTQEISIPKGVMIKENNLFKFQFTKAGKGKNGVPISAKIRSIYLQ